MTSERDLTPDVCVIGAGSAGLTVAAGARAVGLSVVLVERDRMGGECLNTGCVPSKALIAAARHAHAVRRAALFGVDAGPATVDGPRVRAHVRDVIDALAPHDSRERFEQLGVTVIAGIGRFVDRDMVEVGDSRIRARRFVVATGSRPAIPPITGIGDLPILTNESVFDLSVIPRRLLVIGGGPVGLELAQAFARLGSEVTVLDAARPLARDDQECAAIVLSRLKAEGVDVRGGIRVVGAEPDTQGVALIIEGGGSANRLTGSHVLVAAGRAPNVEDLGLDSAGIVASDHGIRTDAALRTTNRRVFAIGDVVGSFRFTHWAGYQAGLVVRSILTGWPHRENPDLACWASYTDPEIAHVGLGEAAARERHGTSVAVHRSTFSGIDRARAERETDGLLKLVTGRGGRILGADIAGPGAAEVASLISLALTGRLTTAAFASMIVPYPTIAEIVRRAALASYSTRLEENATRRILDALRWFGRTVVR